LSLTLSIVTPSFNQGQFLDEAIRSVLSQGYDRLEYLVMDGGSTDDSPAILRRYGNQLAYWCSESDGGQYDALNKGFALTTGEVMGWLNSDDKHTPWALSVIAEIFEAFPQIEWLTTRFPLRWDARGRAVRCSHRTGFSRGAFLAGENLPTGSWYAPGWLQQESTFWRRSLWERAGGRIDTRWQIAADFALWLRFFQHAELYAVDTPLAGFRQHGDQKTTHQKEFYRREATQILHEHGGRAPGFFRSSLRAAAARHCPESLRSLASRAGLMHPCQLCVRKRDESGWQLISSLH
jgi:glycosyltransferase involved in cell wall biosynthesis